MWSPWMVSVIKIIYSCRNELYNLLATLYAHTQHNCWYLTPVCAHDWNPRIISYSIYCLRHFCTVTCYVRTTQIREFGTQLLATQHQHQRNRLTLCRVRTQSRCPVPGAVRWTCSAVAPTRSYRCLPLPPGTAASRPHTAARWHQQSHRGWNRNGTLAPLRWCPSCLGPLLVGAVPSSCPEAGGGGGMWTKTVRK